MSEAPPVPAPPPYSEDNNEEPQDPNQPWADDKLRDANLGRIREDNKSLLARFSEKLTNVVQSFTTDSRVLAITAPYGGGKTFFAKRWKLELEQVGEQVLFFNAWKSDFVSDARTALISQLLQKLESLKDPHGKKLLAEKTIQGIKNIFGAIFNQILPAAAGLAWGVVGEKTVKAAVDTFHKGMQDVGGELLNEESRRAMEVMKEFRNCLKEAAEATPQKRLVILVDELDRCRPDHAIALLECIKHLFNVKGVVFVLFLSENALTQAIKGVYGQSIDAEGYLSRFFQIRRELPSHYPPSFTDALMSRFKLDELKELFDTYSSPQDLIYVFGGMAVAWKMTLRDQHRAVMHLDFCLRTLPNKKQDLRSDLLGFLGALRTANFNLYSKLSHSEIEAYKEILDHIKESQSANKIKLNSQVHEHIFHTLKYALLSLLAFISDKLFNKIHESSIFSDLQNFCQTDILYHRNELRKSLFFSGPSWRNHLTRYFNLLDGLE